MVVKRDILILSKKFCNLTCGKVVDYHKGTLSTTFEDFDNLHVESWFALTAAKCLGLDSLLGHMDSQQSSDEF